MRTPEDCNARWSLRHRARALLPRPRSRALQSIHGYRRSRALARGVWQLDAPLDVERERLAHGRHEGGAGLRTLPAAGGILLGGIQNPISSTELPVIRDRLASGERGVA